MPSDAARERLEHVAQFLENHAAPRDDWGQEIDFAREAACAFRDFLAGREPSLDAAFGVTRPRGAPKTKDAKHLEQAKVILKHLELKRGREVIHWPAVLTELQGKDGSEPDLRELKRMWKSYGGRAWVAAMDMKRGAK